ncbi:IS5 family transposase [Pseudonocardia alni]|uniref:IS5 family transposase n=1 Tax=Pseudonocardia alni TaxID=33907 RepID=UPI00331F20BB
MPLLPASLIEPLWVEFAALIGSPARPEFSPAHPWGCHRRRVSDRVVFDHVIAALVHGSGYERIASPGCSDRTIRRRLDDWASAGVGRQLHRLALSAYDQMIGLDLDDLSVDGSITKSPCGGEISGRSPVDRGKQGTKRSVAGDAEGIPLHLIAARANDHDSPLLEPTLAGICDMIGPLPDTPGMHLDRGYDSTKTRDLLEILGYQAHIALKGEPAPIQAGKRWPVERLHAWMNGFGKLRRFTDKRRDVVEFYLYLAATLTVIRRLINRARTQYRWPTRPITRRLR